MGERVHLAAKQDHVAWRSLQIKGPLGGKGLLIFLQSVDSSPPQYQLGGFIATEIPGKFLRCLNKALKITQIEVRWASWVKMFQTEGATTKKALPHTSPTHVPATVWACLLHQWFSHN